MIVHANDGISTAGVEKLEAHGHTVITTKVAQEQLISFLQEQKVDALIVRSATQVRKELIDACPGLLLVGRGGVGMDNIDVEYAQSKGIAVVNTPAASSQSVAELVFAHLFSLVRSLQEANRNMPLDGDTKFNELKKAYGSGIELRGKTMGIVGFGRIGRAVANMAFGLGMKVVAHDPFITDGTVLFTLADGQTLRCQANMVSLEDVLHTSDFITLHVGGANTLLGAKELAFMKPGSFLINAARGGVVDETALLHALDHGPLAGAGLDVFVGEPHPAVQVLMHPAISLTPHIGAATGEAQDRIGEELADHVISFAAKK